MTDKPPKAGHCKAAPGDYCAVQFFADGDRGRWQLGEVIAVTKQHSRVMMMASRTGEHLKVGPHDRIRVAKLHKINKQRAVALLQASPETGFTTWKRARAYFIAARLNKGETTDGHDHTGS